REVMEGNKTVVITQNGEAKVILQDIHDYEKTQESLAMLKILAMSRKNIEKGKTKPFRNGIRDVRKKAARFL
ncbi:MAG: type II toxin-antitoxin system prevent-host-death family antitoxin, partial [Nitrospinae bacterium]|nr:type II toxin-antitoxin system prevent-host-death family antitoxin [Nitrospinota bacterium]